MTTHAKLAKAYLDQLCDRLDRGQKVSRQKKWWKIVLPAAVGAGMGLVACGGPDTGSDQQNMEEGGYDCQYLPEEPAPQELNCYNDIDDDADGVTDCDDSDCLLACSMVSLYAAPMPVPEICDNQLDDDNDGQVDCDDTNCANDINCSATALYAAPAPDVPVGPAEICDNCLDDNGDGSFDCADAACIGYPGCPPLPELNCSNEVDDDGDGVTDCDDDDCSLDISCSATSLYAAPAPEPEPEPEED